MKLTVLGKYGRYAPKNGATSGYLIENSLGKGLLDLGSGCLARLQKFTAIEDVDFLVLSHLHFDHISDVFTLKYALEFLSAKGIVKKKLKVFLPKTPSDVYDIISSFSCFDCEVIEDGNVCNIGGFKLQFFAMSHPDECYGLKAFAEGKCLAYTADTANKNNLDPLVQNADIVVGDAMFSDAEYKTGAPHLPVGELAKACKGVRLLLTHLPSEGEAEIEKNALLFNEKSELIQEGKTYEIF